MKIILKSIWSVVVFAALFSCSKNGKPTSMNPSMESTVYNPNDSIERIIDKNEIAPKINWLSISEAERYNSVRQKKIMIDMYTDWCGWCKVMDKKTFTNKEVIAYINKNYYPVKFDAESKDSVYFNNKSYAFDGDNNKFAVDMMEGYMSFPTTVYLDHDKSMISHVPGYWSPGDFLLILQFFQENHYKK